MPKVVKARKAKDVVEEVEIFARRFKEARLAKGATQQEIHEETGIAISFLSGVENAQRNLSIEVAAKLAHAVDRKLHELLNPFGR